MKRKRLLRLLMMIMLLLGWFPAGKSGGAGLSTKFSDMILSGLKPGMVYSMKKEHGLGFKVMNNSRTAIDVEVVIESPPERKLREGYETIPDPGWIRVVPQRFVLQPGELSDCDIIISIPVGEEYLNRHFQGSVITQTVAEPTRAGVSISVALETRFRFSTGPTPAKVMDEYRKKVLSALKLEIAPLSLYLSDVEVGETIELGKRDYDTLQLINKSRDSYTIEFQMPGEMKSYGISTGYEPTPDRSWLTFKKKKVKVKSKKIQDIRMTLKIPDKEEYKNRGFAFIVVGDVKGFDLPIQVYGRVYVKTRK